ncbi:bifunctional D-glycero-beta-D-manno-heptose-7-phosphate kinase/D-glycero-beta-D-manno-heptose 1-phosphate adenylyltransferase HldE [Glaciecola petra]|uniref:Bifunctional protein HldE n=1 Tax=Glaciecola petra TaxID=3075602 RepID=A0ABU2ZMV9_9ALTE|nr:bifunctional D-glycero-beta-D-manno-heptose-7-phosphate kinase/D-glycero-beta-D-manno-heptose 1-phosphate adenylyltransferase HldE [Aestuariibacter sp. P117]MDT0593591.1 bifunctional D-glycero-beta-D-manno-heptose-7-phosphate kinase/D-glycero-beta-D-manno-heptose 1-phosphate adenylyltransferase HldE [Aestuariibacter sp. P117]
MHSSKSLPDFSQARLLIVGDLMLDRYYQGGTSRISPEAPVPVVKVEDCEDRPGGAANVAVNAAMLGAKVTLMGFVGNDDGAQVLTDLLEARSVKSDFLKIDGYNTITKLRVMSRNQQLLRLDFEKSFADVGKALLQERFEKHIEDADVVVLSDYAKGGLSEIQELLTLANKYGKPVIVDPKGDDFTKYSGATLITPNVNEFEQVQGHADNEAQLHANAITVCEINNVEHVLLTRSEKGMSLFSRNGKAHHLPALAREVFDVTGAGDTVVSTLACALALNTPIDYACQLANSAAGVVVAKLGTSSVTATELALALNQNKTTDGGVLNQEQLILAVKQAQEKGEKVVMTNGCFDILHAGHVSYLNEAAALGDRLVVAVNSDASVTKLKGIGRPINNVNRRMAVLAGLSSVDWVVEFFEETPQRLISEVLPNVLVKGGDYKIEEIAGADEVIANGGQVNTLCFEDGVSTTAIISQIIDGNS